MASLVYTAIVAGAIGLLAGVVTADSDTLKKIKESVPEAEADLLEDCEKCVLFMEQALDSPDYNPQAEECKVIQSLSKEKLEALIRKFLSSGRIDRGKIRSLARKCTDANDTSTVCTVITETSAMTAEEALSGGAGSDSGEVWFTDSSFDWSDTISVESGVTAYRF